jgi:hypothetical protein
MTRGRTVAVSRLYPGPLAEVFVKARFRSIGLVSTVSARLVPPAGALECVSRCKTRSASVLGETSTGNGKVGPGVAPGVARWAVARNGGHCACMGNETVCVAREDSMRVSVYREIGRVLSPFDS